MKDATSTRSDVERILKDLRRESKASTPSMVLVEEKKGSDSSFEMQELIKSLGIKLKDAYKNLLEKQEEIKALKSHELFLVDQNKQLQALLKDKESENERAKRKEEELVEQNRRLTLLSQSKESETKKASESLLEFKKSTEFISHNEKKYYDTELLRLQQEELSLKQIKEDLQKALEKKEKEHADDKEKLSKVSMKALSSEEEANGLRQERASFQRQFNQLQELHDQTQRSLHLERETGAKQQEVISSNQKTIQELMSSFEKQGKEILSLSQDKNTYESRSKALEEQILSVHETLKQERSRSDSLGKTLSLLQEEHRLLKTDHDSLKTNFSSLDDLFSKTKRQKEEAEEHLQEVETELVAKLEIIHKLDLELEEAIERGDLNEKELSLMKEKYETLTALHQKTEEDLTKAQDSLKKTEKDLSSTSSELSECKRRIETLEKVKKASLEATAIAQSLVRLLDQPLSLSTQSNHSCSEKDLPLFQKTLFQEERNFKNDLF